MKYTRKDYEAFLSTELETQMREYARLVETKAIVLKERGDVFVGRFIKLLENGMLIFKVRVNDNMPRKTPFGLLHISSMKWEVTETGENYHGLI